MIRERKLIPLGVPSDTALSSSTYGLTETMDA